MLFYHTMLLLPRRKVWSFTVVLVTTFLVVVSAAAASTTKEEESSTTSLCRVLDETGQDVTAQRVVVNSEGTVVQCHEAFGCANYTISQCDTVECFEPHACDSATLMEITSHVSCQATQACRRATILFETTAPSSTTDSSTSTSTATIECMGEDACNVAQIHGVSSSLHCQGRKACRKVNAVVDQVVCEGGTKSYPACTGFASLETSSLECLDAIDDNGTQTYGCSPYINQCRTKSIGDDEWQQCPISNGENDDKKDQDGST